MLPAHKLWALGAGTLALWIATGSPLAVLDHRYLTAHMVQHLVLMLIAAPLILLGAPPIRLRLHPALCWLASTAVVIGWHIPALFALGMQSKSWHAFEHASFFAAGLLFWWPVIGREPLWSAPLYLFLATLPCDALSAFLTFCGRVVYPHYLHAPRALADQELAGALMWIVVTFAYLAPAAAVTIQLLTPGRVSATSSSSLIRRSHAPGR
jgi:putative membrane protein